MSESNWDIVVAGAGIVGLATAKRLVEESAMRVLVVEMEKQVAYHQTGHNSGVIHSGLYYRPGSLKAQNCAAGREAMYRFCEDQGIPHKRCGKLVVAIHQGELPALKELERRGNANGLQGIQWIEGDRMKDYEPNVAGVAALVVPQTGIVDYRQVSEAYARLFKAKGGELRLETGLRSIHPADGGFRLVTAKGEIQTIFLVNCAGLQSDRVALLAGVEPDVRIIPFRGDYHLLRPEAAAKVKGLIYPVPNPLLPFLGVHLTRMIDGRVEAGPNAVLSFRREGYSLTSFSLKDTWDTFTFPGFYPMASRFMKVGIGEMIRAFRPKLFAEAAAQLVPGITVNDLAPGGAGVRAQAVDRSGALVDDFRIIQKPGMVHVLNSPSPAATASLSIGEHIAKVILDQMAH